MTDPKDVLIQKLDQKPVDSKKFISMIAGVLSILIVWLGTLIAACIKCDGAQIISLCTLSVPIVIPVIGTMTMAVLTGQVFSDWKTMNSIQKVDDNDKEETIAGIQQNGNGKH